jgi:hypothetical protein
MRCLTPGQDIFAALLPITGLRKNAANIHPTVISPAVFPRFVIVVACTVTTLVIRAVAEIGNRLSPKANVEAFKLPLSESSRATNAPISSTHLIDCDRGCS